MSQSFVNSARTLQDPRPPQGQRAVNSAGGPRSNSKQAYQQQNSSLQMLPPVMPMAAAAATASLGSPAELNTLSSAAVPRPKITLRPLTKLEQQRMDTIPQRQKENRHQPQIVKGKEYQGAGFAANPPVVRFTDFDLKKEYTQTIKLTNVSYTFNSFKVEALPMNLRSVLDVVYVPQSRMVAGRECTIDVIFTPKEIVDIDSSIAITTTTGVLELPVVCRQKRADVTIVGDVKAMDFGSIVIGEEDSRTITFRNSGALPCKMTIEGDAVELFGIEHSELDAATGGGSDDRRNTTTMNGLLTAGGNMGTAEDGTAAAATNGADGNNVPITFANLGLLQQQQPPQQGPSLYQRPGTAGTDTSIATDVLASHRATAAISNRAGGTAASAHAPLAKVKAFSSVPDFSGTLSSGKQPVMILAPFSEQSFTLTFAPRETCHFETSFFFSFDSPDVEDKVVFVKGEAAALPIFISENKRINFQCAFFNTLYRDSFTITNTSKSAAKVSPMVPAILKDALEFVPKFGYAQAGATLTFQIKFTPDPSFAASYVTSRDGSVAFDQAIRVVVSDQTLPLYLNLVARLSHNSIRITQPPNAEVRLGNVYTHEAIETEVVLTNNANIARRVGFVNLPSNIEVRRPAVPVFSILPGESLPITLSIKAPNGSQGQFTQILKIMSEHAEGCSLTITGQGRQAAVELSPSFVAFPPTAAGASSEAHAVLVSKSSVAQEFTFLALARHGVSVQPSRGTIQPYQQVPIVLTFSADPDVIDLKLPPPIREEDFILGGADAAATSGVGRNGSTVGDGKPQKAAAGGNNKKKSKDIEESERLAKVKEEDERRARFEKLQEERDAEVIMIRKLVPWEVSAPGEPWALHRELILPCAIRPTPTASAFSDTEACAALVHASQSSSATSPLGGASPLTAAASSSSSSALPPPRMAKPLFITARCCVVKPVATIQAVQGHDVQRLSSNTANPTSGASPLVGAANNAAAGGASPTGKQLGGKGDGKAGGISRVPSNLKEKGSLANNANSKKQAGAAAAADDKLDANAATLVRAPSYSGAEGDVFAANAAAAAAATTSTPATVLAFGNVPSQHTVAKSLVIRHTSTNPNAIMLLHPHPLDPHGVFTVTRPPQTVLRHIGDSTEIVVKFHPRHEALYEQKLKIMCETIAVEPGTSSASAYNLLTNVSTHTSSVKDANGAFVVNGEVLVPTGQINRHFVVASLTGRGQPAALTITKSTTLGVGAVTNNANGSGAPASSAAPNGNNAAGGGAGGSLNRTSSVVGMPPAPSTPSKDGAANSNNANNTTAAAASSRYPAFSDLATANEKLDQLNAGLKGIPTILTVDMGTCVAGDVLERYYDFTNCSEFSLTVKTELTKILNRNPNHMCPFAVTPSFVTIPAHTSVPICLSFNPTVAGMFSAVAKVRFGGEDSYHDINVSGRATDKGLYVITPHALHADAVKGSNPVNTTLGGPSGISHSSSTSGSPFGAASDEDAASQPPPLPSATTGFVERRQGLSALLSLLPTAAVPAPGTVSSHPLQLSFAATATRTFDTAVDPSDYSAMAAKTAGMSEKERKAEEKRLKKEMQQQQAAAAAAAAASTSNGGSPTSAVNSARGNSSARGNRSPRAMAIQAALLAQQRRDEDGPGLNCTIVSTTATHQFVIGNNRSSTAGEFMIEGLTELDQSYGWKCAVTCVASDDGGGLVSGSNAPGALGMAGGVASANNGAQAGGNSAASPNRAEGAGKDAKGGQANNANAMLSPGTSVIGALPPIRGTLAPGQAALVSITFTPRQPLVESLPLDNVDIVSIADLRITVRGGIPATPPEGKVAHLQLKGVVKNTRS